jgi:hypothetical protein
LRLTLLDYTTSSSGRVTFEIRAEKDGLLPTSFSSTSFTAVTCDGRSYYPLASGRTNSRFYLFSGSDDVLVDFSFTQNRRICELRYFGAGGTMEFDFY